MVLFSKMDTQENMNEKKVPIDSSENKAIEIDPAILNLRLQLPQAGSQLVVDKLDRFSKKAAREVCLFLLV
jgi:hypothetical protein